MANYYNEIDPYAAQWLRNLIAKGLIPDGEVDTRSIVIVQPNDLRGFTQCHFFSGIAGWSLALKIAAWPEDKEIWTGSCPCQPFSVAGKGKGTSDERHLWPHFFRLINACRPSIAIGEQVSGKAGRDWLDGVFSDLEGCGYTTEAFDIPACSVNSPHIRQRFYWVATNLANTSSKGSQGRFVNSTIKGIETRDSNIGAMRSNTDGGDNMGNANSMRELQQEGRIGEERGWPSDTGNSDMADTNNVGCSREEGVASKQRSDGAHDGISIGRGDKLRIDMADTESLRWGFQQPQNNWKASGEIDTSSNDSTSNSRAAYFERPWDNAVWIRGADGKTRRAPGVSQSRLCGLADGISEGMDGLRPAIPLLTTQAEARANKLKCLGNAIVPQLAAEFIKAIMETK